MASSLKKPIVRQIDSFLERGRPVVIRVTDEGVYIKRRGEHWKTAVLCTWGAAFSAACKMKAIKDREEKATRRRIKRGLL